MPDKKEIMPGQPNPYRRGPLGPVNEYQRDGVEPEWDGTIISGKSKNGWIRVMKAPKGEAPLEIREKWIMLLLPCEPIASNKGVLIRQDYALEILEKREPEAATYWRSRGLPKDGEYFNFEIDEVLILHGVTFQKIIHVPEEVQGHTDR